MPKERSINPAAAQRKADKQKEISKSKKNLQSQRNEKLARRNPERLQRQIDDLKELEARGSLRPKDKETLAQLEKDVRGVRRAREALGDAAPKFAERRDRGPDRGFGGDARQEQRERREGQQRHLLGKRRRDAEDAHSDSGEETDPDVRIIPMPRDTPPPIPRARFTDPRVGADGQRRPHELPAKPAPTAPAQTVYSSAPQLRDLKKEAVRFMPSAVAQQRARVKGVGKLLEPEEADRLERAGYLGGTKKEGAGQDVREGGDGMDEEARRLERELAELAGEPGGNASRTVEMDEVEDDGN